MADRSWTVRVQKMTDTNKGSPPAHAARVTSSRVGLRKRCATPGDRRANAGKRPSKSTFRPSEKTPKPSATQGNTVDLGDLPRFQRFPALDDTPVSQLQRQVPPRAGRRRGRDRRYQLRWRRT